MLECPPVNIICGNTLARVRTWSLTSHVDSIVPICAFPPTVLSLRKALQDRADGPAKRNTMV